MAKADTIGRLMTYVDVQQENGTTRNDFNEEVPNWQTIWRGYVAIEPLTSQEVFNAAQMQMAVSGRMRFRYRPDVILTGDMRAIQTKGGRSRIFQFAGPAQNEGERNEWWVVPFVERVENAK